MRTLRLQLFFVAAALAMGGAVWVTASAQRTTATTRSHRLADAQALEDTTLYQELEAGLSNEAPEHRLEEFLGKEAEDGVVFERIRADAHGNDAVLHALDRADGPHRRWFELARHAFGTATPSAAQTDERHALIEDLGTKVVALQAQIAKSQDANQRFLEWVLVLLSAGLTLVAV